MDLNRTLKLLKILFLVSSILTSGIVKSYLNNNLEFDTKDFFVKSNVVDSFGITVCSVKNLEHPTENEPYFPIKLSRGFGEFIPKVIFLQYLLVINGNSLIGVTPKYNSITKYFLIFEIDQPPQLISYISF